MPRVHKLIAFSVLIMFSFTAFVAVQAIRSYQLTHWQSKQDNARLARIVAEHVELTFLSVDLSLRRAAERQYFNALFGGNLPEYMKNNFSVWVEELPQISAMVLLNAQGDLEASAHEKTFSQLTLTKQTPFGQRILEANRQADPGSILFFVVPDFSQAKDHPIILVTHRLENLAGAFDGLILAAMDSSYFIEFFDSVSIAEHHFLGIMLDDGRVMASGPEIAHKEAHIHHMQGALEALEKDIIKTYEHSIEGVDKLFSSKWLETLPIGVTVAMDPRDYLAAWRSNQFKDVMLLSIFLLFGTAISLFTIAMDRQIDKVQQSEANAVLASQTKSEFLANMSHEFRTPLNAIIGFSEMLLGGYFGDLTAKQKERINDVNLCGTHLLQLINDILEFSKGEAGKLELREEQLNLHEIIEECRRIMQEKLNAKQITMEMQLATKALWLVGDKRKLRQMLLNLLSNAHKFTPEGGNITVSTAIGEEEDIHLRVSDTGIGIAEKDIHTALSIFGQVHRDQSAEGTGLGLPLCKIFAELHGGKLSLTSTVGEGTTVEVTLPASRFLTRDNEPSKKRHVKTDRQRQHRDWRDPEQRIKKRKSEKSS